MPATVQQPFGKHISIKLDEEHYKLPEVSVTAEKMDTKGDTVTYYVPTLISQGDQVLGDILQKLSGVNVSQGGHVQYRGKDISKMYIDSVDLLGSKYNIAVENLNPNDISRIEIYENHQHIKALRGTIIPENAAINIIMKKESRDVWITSLCAEAGASSSKPWVPYSGEVFAANIGGKLMTMNTVGTDATGEITSIDNAIAYDNIIPSQEFKNRYKAPEYLKIPHILAPLDASRSRFNTTYSVSSHNNFRIKETNLGISGIFRHESLNSLSSAQSVYNSGDQTVADFTEINSISSSELYGAIDISAEINTDKSFINDKMRIEYTGSDAISALTGSALRNQNAGRQEINIMNNIDATFRTGRGNFISFKMFSEYLEKNEIMDVLDPSDSTDSRQNINTKHFYNNLSFSHAVPIGDFLAFTSICRIEYLFKDFKSTLTGVDIDESIFPHNNDFSLQYILPKEHLALSFKYKNFDAILQGVLQYRYLYSTIDNLRHHHDFSISPALTLNYKFGPRFKISAFGTYNVKNADERGIYSGLILQNYKHLSLGRTELTQTPEWTTNLSLDFSEPLSGWTAYISASYASSKSFQTTRYFIDDYIVNVLSNDVTGYSALSADISISKTFLNAGSKVTADFSFSNTRSTINQDGTDYRYTGRGYNASLSFLGNISTWMRIKYYGTYGFSRYSTDRKWNSKGNHSSTHNLTLTFFPHKSIELSVGAEYYMDKPDGRDLKQTVFLDASARYAITDRISIYLKAKNLLNSKTYSYSMLMPLQSSYYEFRIRPLNVLLGLDIRF